VRRGLGNTECFLASRTILRGGPAFGSQCLKLETNPAASGRKGSTPAQSALFSKFFWFGRCDRRSPSRFSAGASSRWRAGQAAQSLRVAAGGGKPLTNAEDSNGVEHKTPLPARRRARRHHTPSVVPSGWPGYLTPGPRSRAPRIPSCSGCRAILSVNTRTSLTIGLSSCVSRLTLVAATARSS
jgi:hypothetical protein